MPVQFPSLPVHKYLRSETGVVGTIYDGSGVFSHITADQHALFGDAQAAYLDTHGYGPTQVRNIANALQASSCAEEFVGRIVDGGGCGLSVVELEWFWTLR
jgi:hypothetical protein